MKIDGDIAESLVGEILNDAATSFFDARRTIESKIDLFHEYADGLRQMSADVFSAAALLNLLLVDDRQAKTFYRTIGLDDEMFLAAKNVDPRDVLAGIPFAIGFNNRYKKLVYSVYVHLQKKCVVYMDGPPETTRMSPPRNPNPIYYRLIVKMLQILNQEIGRINETVSPSCTLQFAKKFQPDLLAKEKITGGGLSDSQSLDKKLCYRPIDPDALGLIAFPKLPKPETVKSSIFDFCKKLSRQYPDQLRQIVDFIKHRIHAD